MSVRRRLLAGCAAAVLLLGSAACGGTPKLTGKDKTAAANLSHAFQDQGLTAADADCVSDKWVRKVGAKKLIAAGLLNSDLKPGTTSKKPTKSTVDPYVAAYFSCVDYGRLEARKFDKAKPNIIDKTQFAACANKIDRHDAKQAMRDNLLGVNSTVATDVQHELLLCANA